MPVKTDLTFDTLDACVKAEEDIRGKQAQKFNEWLAWARQNQEKSGYPDHQEFIMKVTGLRNLMTCIPHKTSN